MGMTLINDIEALIAEALATPLIHSTPVAAMDGLAMALAMERPLDEVRSRLLELAHLTEDLLEMGFPQPCTPEQLEQRRERRIDVVVREARDMERSARDWGFRELAAMAELLAEAERRANGPGHPAAMGHGVHDRRVVTARALLWAHALPTASIFQFHGDLVVLPIQGHPAWGTDPMPQPEDHYVEGLGEHEVLVSNGLRYHADSGMQLHGGPTRILRAHRP